MPLYFSIDCLVIVPIIELKAVGTSHATSATFLGTYEFQYQLDSYTEEMDKNRKYGALSDMKIFISSNSVLAALTIPIFQPK